jgi:hypothetical protein
MLPGSPHTALNPNRTSSKSQSRSLANQTQKTPRLDQRVHRHHKAIPPGNHERTWTFTRRIPHSRRCRANGPDRQHVDGVNRTGELAGRTTDDGQRRTPGITCRAQATYILIIESTHYVGAQPVETCDSTSPGDRHKLTHRIPVDQAKPGRRARPPSRTTSPPEPTMPPPCWSASKPRARTRYSTGSPFKTTTMCAANSPTAWASRSFTPASCGTRWACCCREPSATPADRRTLGHRGLASVSGYIKITDLRRYEAYQAMHTGARRIQSP